MLPAQCTVTVFPQIAWNLVKIIGFFYGFEGYALTKVIVKCDSDIACSQIKKTGALE